MSSGIDREADRDRILSLAQKPVIVVFQTCHAGMLQCIAEDMLPGQMPLPALRHPHDRHSITADVAGIDAAEKGLSRTDAVQDGLHFLGVGQDCPHSLRRRRSGGIVRRAAVDKRLPVPVVNRTLRVTGCQDCLALAHGSFQIRHPVHQQHQIQRQQHKGEHQIKLGCDYSSAHKNPSHESMGGIREIMQSPLRMQRLPASAARWDPCRRAHRTQTARRA